MSVSQEEGVIIGCIIGITILIIFGLLLWYFCSKTNVESTQYNPIIDEQETPHNDTKKFDLETANGTKPVIETQAMLSSESTRKSSTDAMFIDGESTKIHGAKDVVDADIVTKDAQTINESITAPPTDNKEYKIDSTGIVLVDSIYKLEVAQALTINDMDTLPEKEIEKATQQNIDINDDDIKRSENTLDIEEVDDDKEDEQQINDQMEDEVQHSVTLEELDKVQVTQTLTGMLLKYDDSVEEHDIERIVNNKDIDGKRLYQLINEENCDELAAAFSILGIEKADWKNIYHDLKEQNKE